MRVDRGFAKNNTYRAVPTALGISSDQGPSPSGLGSRLAVGPPGLDGASTGVRDFSTLSPERLTGELRLLTELHRCSLFTPF